MKLSLYVPVFVALAGSLFASASPLLGQAATEPKARKLPFHGKLLSVDPGAQVITVSGKTPRVFHLTPATKITDGGGNPSRLSAAVVGEDVGGSYTRDAAGTMTLFSVRFGAKTSAKAGGEASPTAPASASGPPAPAPAAASPPPSATPPPAATPTATAKPKKQTFSGKVVSVDPGANTLVVHGRADHTFTLTPATKITGAAGLSEVAAGTRVSGTYVKSADGGTLTVYTLKVVK